MNQLKRERTIVCISPDSWRGLFRSRQQIMSRLAKDFRIVYLEPGRLMGENQLKSAIGAMKNFLNISTYEPIENITVVTGVPLLPHFRTQLPESVLKFSYPFISRINYTYTKQHFKRALKELEVEDPIVWLCGFGDYGMDAHRFFDDLDNSLTCYQVYDESPDFAHNKRIQKQLRNADDVTCKKADVVITTSKSQFDRREGLNSNMFFTPNGVNFPLFNSPMVEDIPLPADIADLPKPIIGFSGWMGYQIDVPLLIKVAKKYVHGSVVLLGPNDIPQTPELKAFMEMPNVHFLGRKQPQEMPSYFQAFDAATIPYVMAGHTRYIYPLKLHEYLAAGRTVVSTDLPNLYPHKDLVHIAMSHDEYLEQLDVAIADYSPDAVKARTDLAKKYSWDDRVKEIKDILEDHLKSKFGSAKVAELERVP